MNSIQFIALLTFSSIFWGCVEKNSTTCQEEVTTSYNNPMKANQNEIEVKLIWRNLIEAVKEKNFKKFVSLSLDTISVCNTRMSPKNFLNGCSTALFNETLYNRIKDTTKIDVKNNEVISSYYSTHFLSNLKFYTKTFIIKRVQVDLKDDAPHIIAFDFVENKDSYKFISCDVYGGPQCCL